MTLLKDVVTIDRASVQPEDIREGETYLGLESIAVGGAILGYPTVCGGELHSSKFAFDKRHVLFGKLRPNLAKVARPEFSGICSTDILPLLPGQEVDRNYLAHYLLTPSTIRWATSRTSGVNLPRLSPRVLGALQIPLPPLPEQRRIAAILDQADALRTKRRRALALLDELADSVFIDMFGDLLAEPPATTEIALLGTLAEVVSGVTVGRKTPKGSLRSVPYLTVANVQDKRINMTKVKTIDASEAEIQRYALASGDLLLTEGGDPDKLGRGALWSGEIKECIHQNHVFRVRITDSRIEPVFLNWVVGSRYGKSYFFRSAKQTTGIASINSTQLRSFPVPIAPVSQQREFIQRLGWLGINRRDQRFAMDRLDSLFASLQYRAFHGDL